MSRQFTHKSHQNQQPHKYRTKTDSRGKYCSFCQKSGAPVETYKSHYLKDKPGPDGKIVCPAILSNICRYCHEKGHTTKYCSVLKNKNNGRRQNNTDYRNKHPSNETTGGWKKINKPINTRFSSLKPSPTNRANTNKSPSSNSFSVLDDEKESEQNQEAMAHENEPKFESKPKPKSKPQLPVLKEKEAPKVVNIKQPLQGAWGKKLSSAVTTEQKFEKPTRKIPDEDGMVAIDLIKQNSSNTVKHHLKYKKHYNPMTFKSNQSWADMADEEESNYYDPNCDIYSDSYYSSSHNTNTNSESDDSFYSDDEYNY